MIWDQDFLVYGYVLSQVAGGGWWHLHFGRSGWDYNCELLGCRTDILACVQRFAAGGWRNPRGSSSPSTARASNCLRRNPGSTSGGAIGRLTLNWPTRRGTSSER